MVLYSLLIVTHLTPHNTWQQHQAGRLVRVGNHQPKK